MKNRFIDFIFSGVALVLMLWIFVVQLPSFEYRSITIFTLVFLAVTVFLVATFFLLKNKFTIKMFSKLSIYAQLLIIFFYFLEFTFLSIDNTAWVPGVVGYQPPWQYSIAIAISSFLYTIIICSYILAFISLFIIRIFNYKYREKKENVL